MPKLFSLVFVVLFLSSCTPHTAIRGNFTASENIDEIKAGKQTKLQVKELLGPASMENEHHDEWVYIGEKTEHLAFFEPKIIERKVIVIGFDKQGIVSSIKKLDKNDGKHVYHVTRETPTAGDDVSGLKQILGNFGKLSTGTGRGR